jgi:hypothetical protein
MKNKNLKAALSKKAFPKYPYKNRFSMVETFDDGDTRIADDEELSEEEMAKELKFQDILEDD